VPCWSIHPGMMRRWFEHHGDDISVFLLFVLVLLLLLLYDLVINVWWAVISLRILSGACSLVM